MSLRHSNQVLRGSAPRNNLEVSKRLAKNAQTVLKIASLRTETHHFGTGMYPKRHLSTEKPVKTEENSKYPQFRN